MLYITKPYIIARRGRKKSLDVGQEGDKTGFGEYISNFSTMEGLNSLCLNYLGDSLSQILE